MTPEQLADAYADACFEQGLNQRTVDPEPEKRREALITELRRLAAIEAAAKKLIAAKGRYHTEQNYRALEALIKETP